MATGTGSATGAEGARRVLAVLQAFSPQFHTLTAREMAGATGIPLPSMYRYIALLRDMGIIIGDERGSYRLSAKVLSLARAAEAAEREENPPPDPGDDASPASVDGPT